MRKPLFVRKYTFDEEYALFRGLRARNAPQRRRCRIVLLSSRKWHAQEIADYLHCDDETVRRIIKAFNTYGVAALEPASSRPHRTRDAFSTTGRARLEEIIRQSPQSFGKDSKVWTLNLLAEIAYAEGLTLIQVSGQTIRTALKHLGIDWLQAKRTITNTAPSKPENP